MYTRIIVYLDVDECSVNNGGCNQTCFNNQGSFTCGCNDGYQLMGDNKSCYGINIRAYQINIKT